MPPQLRQSSIAASDIQRFLGERDDFAFEMQVKNLLIAKKILGSEFHMDHGGHYTDSVSGKSRQFDLRAYLNVGLFHLRMSVECKQLTTAYPLVVSRVPRSGPDSFHYLIVSKPRDIAAQYEDRPNFHVARSAYGASPYLAGERVGKSCLQLGVARNSPHEFVIGDSAIFEKWSQALASAEELVWGSIHDHDHRARGEAVKYSRSVVLPLLVVPNGTLWVQDYSDVGIRDGHPRQIDHCEYYVGKHIERASPWMRFVITHMHILTLDGLEEFTHGPSGLNAMWPARLFPDFEGGSCLPIEWNDRPPDSKPRAAF